MVQSQYPALRHEVSMYVQTPAQVMEARRRSNKNIPLPPSAPLSGRSGSSHLQLATQWAEALQRMRKREERRPLREYQDLRHAVLAVARDYSPLAITDSIVVKRYTRSTAGGEVQDIPLGIVRQMLEYLTYDDHSLRELPSEGPLRWSNRRFVPERLSVRLVNHLRSAYDRVMDYVEDQRETANAILGRDPDLY